MPDVFNRHGFGPSVAVKQPSSCSWVDHLRFGSTTSDWVALLGLAFASPPAQNALGSPLTVTRRLIKQKARHHRAISDGSECSRFDVRCMILVRRALARAFVQIKHQTSYIKHPAFEEGSALTPCKHIISG